MTLADTVALFWDLAKPIVPFIIVCSPKDEFLAIITAYLPDKNEWSSGFRVRIK